MSPEFSFPFSEQFIDVAGQKGVSTMATVILALVGPPRSGESMSDWEARADEACATVVQSILMAVDARNAVLVTAAEVEGKSEVRQ